MRLAVKACIRIIIIFIALQAFFSFLNYASSMIFNYQVYSEDYNLPFQVAVLAVSALVVAAVLGVLWWRTNWVVNVLVGRMPERELVVSTSNLDLVRVAMRILGIVLLVFAVPELIGLIGYHFSVQDEFGGTVLYYNTADEVRDLIIAVVKILLGVWLLVGTRKIVKAIDKVWDKTP